MSGVCPGRTPKPPLAPGSRTSSHSTVSARCSGVTISRERAMGYPASVFALAMAPSIEPTR